MKPGPFGTGLFRYANALARSAARGADFQDSVPAVVRHQQAAIGSNSDADRTSPALDGRAAFTIADDETGHEVFERSRTPVVQREERHPGTGPHGTVPRPVQRHEATVSVARRELRTRVEGDAERG